MNCLKLKGKRISLGVTRSGAGAVIGKNENTYAYKERGDTAITLDEAGKLAIDWKMSFEEFNDIFFDGILPFGK
ncbi:MAG: helix-turn-helix domain-containing protein [Oscillospiraceae bacterium]|nr:helix-turn-helix domain-containing protein [Oscillospiraceae bacterium]